MLDDFFTRALLAGIGVALLTGPTGCFILWRRMAYFGDTLAHSALLGIALSLLASLPVMLTVFVVASGVAILLPGLERLGRWSSDSLLGILSHGALACGLVLMAFVARTPPDLQAILFGDILAVTANEIGIIYGGGAVLLALLALIWRSLLAASVSPEIAAAEGMRPERSKFLFMLMMALVIAVAMKIVGILLVTAMLIIPAATARRYAWSPESMAVLAALAGSLAVIGGMYGSLAFDTPSGPSIVVAALLLFVPGLFLRIRGRKPGQKKERGS